MNSNTSAGLALATVSRPDLVLPEEGEPSSIQVASHAALGLAGAGAFSLIAALATEGGGGDATLVVVPFLATLLTFPPLYLLTTVRGRTPGLARLLAVAVAGPAIAGTALGASSPLLLLYALTGEIDASFALLAVGLALAAAALGALGAVKNARRVGPQSPGALVILGHYTLTLWTAMALALHLS